MSDDQDRESQTEEPTEKRLQEAADKGNDPVSREVPIFASLLAALLGCSFLVTSAVISLTQILQNIFDSIAERRLHQGSDAQEFVVTLIYKISTEIWPILSIFVCFGLFAHFGQSLPRFILSRITPDFSRISLMGGIIRLFGVKGFIHFGRTCLQLFIIIAVLWLVLSAQQERILNLINLRPRLIPEELLTLFLYLISGVAAASSLLVIGDLVWTRIQWRRDLRMTKQEVKEEARQSEGDPAVKARLRSIALDRARRRMMAQVPRATLVIANPTHYAIAIRYVKEEGGVPMVLAKGQDLIALKIREIAENSGVPVMEQKLLARSMYDLVEVDNAIPAEFYRAVAELIHLLSRKKTGLLPAR